MGPSLPQKLTEIGAQILGAAYEESAGESRKKGHEEAGSLRGGMGRCVAVDPRGGLECTTRGKSQRKIKVKGNELDQSIGYGATINNQVTGT